MSHLSLGYIVSMCKKSLSNMANAFRVPCLEAAANTEQQWAEVGKCTQPRLFIWRIEVFFLSCFLLLLAHLFSHRVHANDTLFLHITLHNIFLTSPPPCGYFSFWCHFFTHLNKCQISWENSAGKNQ